MTVLSPSQTDVQDPRSPLNSAKVLRECCESDVGCRFHMLHSGVSTDATFVRMDTHGIELHVAAASNRSSIEIAAVCCVSFTYLNYFGAFATCVLNAELQSSGELLVVLAPPKDVTVVNRRQWFRVPVLPDSGVEIAIHSPDKRQLKGKPVTIAYGGADVDLSNCDHQLSVGQNVDFELRYEGQYFRSSAEIRRFTDSRCGLSFTNPSGEDSERMGESLKRIVRRLQHQWLRTRLK